MKYGIIHGHPDIGTTFVLERKGEVVLAGVCDRVEVQAASFRNAKTGRRTATKKIRLRLKVGQKRARWTDWFPYR